MRVFTSPGDRFVGETLRTPNLDASGQKMVVALAREASERIAVAIVNFMLFRVVKRRNQDVG